MTAETTKQHCDALFNGCATKFALTDNERKAFFVGMKMASLGQCTVLKDLLERDIDDRGIVLQMITLLCSQLDKIEAEVSVEDKA